MSQCGNIPRILLSVDIHDLFFNHKDFFFFYVKCPSVIYTVFQLSKLICLRFECLTNRSEGLHLDGAYMTDRGFRLVLDNRTVAFSLPEVVLSRTFKSSCWFLWSGTMFHQNTITYLFLFKRGDIVSLDWCSQSSYRPVFLCWRNTTKVHF